MKFNAEVIGNMPRSLKQSKTRSVEPSCLRGSLQGSRLLSFALSMVLAGLPLISSATALVVDANRAATTTAIGAWLIPLAQKPTDPKKPDPPQPPAPKPEPPRPQPPTPQPPTPQPPRPAEPPRPVETPRPIEAPRPVEPAKPTVAPKPVESSRPPVATQPAPIQNNSQPSKPAPSPAPAPQAKPAPAPPAIPAAPRPSAPIPVAPKPIAPAPVRPTSNPQPVTHPVPVPIPVINQSIPAAKPDPGLGRGSGSTPPPSKPSAPAGGNRPSPSTPSNTKGAGNGKGSGQQSVASITPVYQISLPNPPTTAGQDTGIGRASAGQPIRPQTYNLRAKGTLPSEAIPHRPILTPNKSANLGYLVSRTIAPLKVDRRPYRVGYYAYDPSWQDAYFGCVAYSFDPYSNASFLSPLYSYCALPGYIDATRVTVLDGDQLPTAFQGSDYLWDQYAYEQGYNDGLYAAQKDEAQLDKVLQDLVQTFEKKDETDLSELVGRSEKVNISMDGSYLYTLSSDDFFDMIRDEIRTVKTLKYEIIDVQAAHDGQGLTEAKVVARHTYTDPWGNAQTVFHSFRIGFSVSGSHITEFGTSESRPY